ncbi:hypothetical protein EYZ11_004088 [Aspergillus tanneri]|uniref:Uncharacterized protein n=1 Tax=Aspergillus tanneri TaxID=1220188 RepID=A0A4S3JLF6_9EURO|nr:hypothetical protein EYZ11_004088 [Aspergillus tanneri]
MFLKPFSGVETYHTSKAFVEPLSNAPSDCQRCCNANAA